jgi:cation diffusion facilitator family transporter
MPDLPRKRTAVSYGYLSIAASLVTLALKFGAWFASGSVGLLSDALESLVNLAAGIFATVSLIIANRPPDECHPYGHGKVEFLASGFEGGLIVLAAAGILYSSAQRILHPVELAALDTGLAVAVAAAAVNFVTARIMLKASRHFDSLTLEADAKHLLTDVWTSAGMVAGLSLILIGGSRFLILDPLIAMLMAGHIAWTGLGLIKTAVENLMDKSLSEQELDRVRATIESHVAGAASYHALRSRKSGAVRYIEFHLLVPGGTDLAAAHDLTCRIERDIKAAIPQARVLIHIEPLEDHRSYETH